MTDPGPTPLLFGFRGIRFLQVTVALAAMGAAIGGIVLVLSYVDQKQPWSLLLAIILGLFFLWLFGAALRLPTSFI
ncbi:MAG: hypothetical protein WBO97_08285, partial [Tepidiformaceae bacterium]